MKTELQIKNDRGRWFDICNVSTDAADVFIYDGIGMFGVSASDFLADIRGLQVATLNVHINSPGGSVFEGFAIYNALKAHSAKVVVHVDALAASIASLIAMAGDEIVMAENAMMMVHRPTAGIAGNAEDLRQTAELLDKLEVGMVNTYAARTGLPAADVAAAMTRTTWYSAAECKANGFCTAIGPATQIDASPTGKMSKPNDAAAGAAPIVETFTAEAVTAKVQAAVEAAHAAAKVALDSAKAEALATLNAARAQHATAVSAKDTEIAELKTKLAAAEALSAANLGTDPVAHVATAVGALTKQPTSPLEILNHYRGLKGKERDAFFVTNKAAIWEAYEDEMRTAR